MASKGRPKVESKEPKNGSTRSQTQKRKSTLPKRKSIAPKIKRHQLPTGNPVRAKRIAAKKEEKLAIKIPPVLLHHSFVPSGTLEAQSTIKPKAQGQKPRIWLLARDPYCLFVAWELDSRWQSEYNQSSRDGHLIVRVFESATGEKIAEIHVHPDSKSWFVRVPRSGIPYRASLGFYSKQEAWTNLARSAPERTPTVSETHTRKETIVEPTPEGESLAAPLEPTTRSASEDVPELPTPTLDESSLDSETTTTEPEMISQKEAPPAREDRLDAEPAASGQNTDWTQADLQTEALIQSGTEFAAASLLNLAAPLLKDLGLDWASGSLTTLPPQRSDFWFSVDADLIIYGSTEPNAKVTLGGHAVELRPDGTFSLRISLPDGRHAIPAEATSADGTKSVKIDLWFQRGTRRLEP